MRKCVRPRHLEDAASSATNATRSSSSRAITDYRLDSNCRYHSQNPYQKATCKVNLRNAGPSPDGGLAVSSAATRPDDGRPTTLRNRSCRVAAYTAQDCARSASQRRGLLHATKLPGAPACSISWQAPGPACLRPQEAACDLPPSTLRQRRRREARIEENDGLRSKSTAQSPSQRS